MKKKFIKIVISERKTTVIFGGHRQVFEWHGHETLWHCFCLSHLWMSDSQSTERPLLRIFWQSLRRLGGSYFSYEALLSRSM